MTADDAVPPGSPADLARRFREAADQLLAGWSAAAGAATAGATANPAATNSAAAGFATGPPPALPGLPATMSARQVQAVVDDLATRRAQVQALRASLDIFDQQLGSLEANLRPLLEWTRTWADLERAVGDFWRPPGAGSAD